MSDENTVDEIVVSFVGLHFLPHGLTVEELADTIASVDVSSCAAVVIPEPGARGVGRLAGVTIPPLVADRILARCTPMTDAIKRVEGNRVVETVDRSGLFVVDWPMVVTIGLATRWAAQVLLEPTDPALDPSADGDDASSTLDRGRRPTVAALLSHFVRIEPGLRVVGIDDLS